MNRLIDADAILDKWNKLSERGRKEFDQVIMCEPIFEVENNLEVYTVQNTTGDPTAINVFTFHVDENGDTYFSIEDYCNWFQAAVNNLPEHIACCLLPDDMRADIWGKETVQAWIDNVQKMLNDMK